jgi:hypothetical protein
VFSCAATSNVPCNGRAQRRSAPLGLETLLLHPAPPRLDDQGRITLDEAALLLDEPGSCLRPSPTPLPLLATFEEELRYFLGDEAYEALARQQGLPMPPTQNPPSAPERTLAA